MGVVIPPNDRNVLDDITEGQYSDGLLFFGRRDVLLAQPFDVGRLALAGEPRAVAQGIATLASGRYAFSVTPSGALAFFRRSDSHPLARLTSPLMAIVSRSRDPTTTIRPSGSSR